MTRDSIPRRRALTVCSLCCAGVIVAMGCERPATIRVDGSSTVYPITEAAAHGFRQTRADIRITVGYSGTGGGLKKLIAGEIDVCDGSRPLTPSEQRALDGVGIEISQLAIALDGLSVVVHPENDWVECLTLEQLREIWQPQSRIRKWSDLDPTWPDVTICLFGPGPDSGTFDYFTSRVCGSARASRTDYTASEDDNMLVRGVAENLHALGYFGYAYFLANRHRLKLLAVDAGTGGIYPSLESVVSDAYHPLTRPLYIFVNRSALARSDVADFVEFYVKNAHQFAKQAGYIPIPRDLAAENNRLISEWTGSMRVNGDSNG